MTATKRNMAGFEKNCNEDVLAMYFKEINNVPLLSREDEHRIAREAARGNRAARNRLVSANLRFVVNVAKKYQGQGLPLEDLISEGNIGLLCAVERFDSARGYHFISYAVWWIRQAILKAICEKSRMIRLPVNRVNELVQIEKARKYVQGGEQELEEIARFLGMDTARVSELVNISREMVSLEQPLFEEKDSSVIGDFIESESRYSPDEMILASALQDDIESVLNTLDKKEADVLRFHYGLGDKEPMSLKEIGDHFDLTKERIRQIEKKALKKAQHPVRRRFLENYVA